MMNNKILESLGQNNSRQFIPQDISTYSFLYLLYKLRSQGIEIKVSEHPVESIDKCTLKEDIKKVLLEYAELPEHFYDYYLEKCTDSNILKLFENTTFSGTENSTETSTDLYWLISCLLKLDEKDEAGIFFNEPYTIRRYFRDNFKVNNITGYEPSKEGWAFLLLKDDLLHTDFLKQIYNVDCNQLNLLIADQFNKIYAFPKIYQKQNSDTRGNQRVIQNMDRSLEDNTGIHIAKVLSTLKENGRAVILVSNAFFTRNYFYYHQDLIKDRNLTGIINLSAGAVYPPNVTASFLIFEKKADNKGIRFLDLRGFGAEIFKMSYGINNSLNPIDRNKIKTLWEQEDSDYSFTVSYEQIIENNYDLNFITYKYNQGLLKKLDSVQGEEKEYFILGEEAEISKSQPKDPDFKLLEPEFVVSEMSRDLGRFLRISDISDNKIQQTMPVVLGTIHADKPTLEEEDIVISKVLPLKIALYRKKINEVVYPGPNLFIIRLKKDSKLRPCYLKAYLESEACAPVWKQLASGGTMSVITKKVLELIQVPYKSFKEQLIFEQQYFDYEDKMLELERNLKELRSNQRNLLMEL